MLNKTKNEEYDLINEMKHNTLELYQQYDDKLTAQKYFDFYTKLNYDVVLADNIITRNSNKNGFYIRRKGYIPQTSQK